MKIYNGGSAIMLKTNVPYDQRQQINEKVFDSTWKRTMPDDLHMTLQFVGRDLPASDVSAMIMGAFLLEPVTISLTGKFKRFGTTKGQYIVLEVVKSEALIKQRDLVRQFLDDAGIKIKDTFQWNPHITVMETTTPGTMSQGEAWASSKRPDLIIPDPIEPMQIDCTEIEIKYGQRKMVIDL
jgi:2'-5' RNA ligase